MAYTVKQVDSFDDYTTTAQLLTKWTSHAGPPSIGAVGRNGTSGLNCPDPAYGVDKVVTAEQFHYAGAAFKFTTLPTSDCVIMSFRDAASAQIDLRLTPAGTFRVTRNGTSLGLGTLAVSAATYFYVEFMAKIHSSTGTFDVYLNGAATADVTGTGQNTQATGNATADTFRICRIAAAGAVGPTVDDSFYLSGSTAPPRWGDVRAEFIKPNGNGNSSQWLGSDGNSTDNYLLVDESTPNDDTDYLSSSTVNDLDLFTYTDVTPTTGTVVCVAVNMWARKDDAGVRTIAPATREGGTTSIGTNVNLTTTYDRYRQFYETNPRTAAAYTISEINGSEWGVKEIA
jgi:hypothetical protein